MDDGLDPLQVEIDIDAAIRTEVERCAEEGIGGDIAFEAKGTADLAQRHPEVTGELMVGAAQVAREARQVLSSPWAVYQARDARTALAAALDLLMTAQGIVGDVLSGVETARRRGDIPETPGLTHALHTAREAAERLRGSGRYEIGTVFEALAATEKHSPARLPRDSHETVHAAAAAFGDAASVDTSHHDDADAAESYCGCILVVSIEGRTWYVSWNDEWGAVLDTGRTDSYTLTEGVDFTELGVTAVDIHPDQLVEAIHERTRALVGT